MFRRVSHVLMIFAVLAVTGSHWAILQSVALTTMLADNLQYTSFREAITRTFDGKHPCCLCKQIVQEKQKEKKTEFSVDLQKLEFCYDSAEFIFIAPEYFWMAGSAQQSLHALSQAPPTPPPRLA